MIVLLVSPFFGCTHLNDNRIFTKGREWLYIVIKKNEKGDTVWLEKIKLEVISPTFKSIMNSQTAVRYTYLTENSNKIEQRKETTGVDEEENHVYLHPPRNNYMAFTELSPFPEGHFPVGVAVESDITLNVVQGYDSLDGQALKAVIKQYKESIDTTILDIEYLGCARVTGKLISHPQFGNWQSYYLVHPQKGFVYWRYTLNDGSIVELLLKNK